MEYVRLFEMLDERNQPEYFLAFASHSPHGLRVIEDAMWTADQARGAQFSDYAAPDPQQGLLFEPAPEYAELEKLILDHFAGQRDVPIHEVNDFVFKGTDFRETHGRAVLSEAHGKGLVTVRPPLGKPANYWGEGTTVTFMPAD